MTRRELLTRERRSWVGAEKHFRKLALKPRSSFLCWRFEDDNTPVSRSALARIRATSLRRGEEFAVGNPPLWPTSPAGHKARARYCIQKVKEIDRELAKLAKVAKVRGKGKG